MKKLLILLMFFTSASYADEVVVHLGSYHTAYRSELKQGNALNEVNLGIGWQNDKWSAGIYRSSQSEDVTYAARKWTHGNFFVFAGLANADPTIAPIVPFVGAGVDLGTLQLVAFPSVIHLPDRDEVFTTIGVSLKFGI